LRKKRENYIVKDVTRAIKEDYGTVKRFCAIKGLKYNSFRTQLSQYTLSKSTLNKLKQENLISGE
jgi:hypothetical protein